ncbi:MAG: hypothetical protein AB2796_15775 [Candidatus Thiodiazotropha sp.]
MKKTRNTLPGKQGKGKRNVAKTGAATTLKLEQLGVWIPAQIMCKEGKTMAKLLDGSEAIIEVTRTKGSAQPDRKRVQVRVKQLLPFVCEVGE